MLNIKNNWAKCVKSVSNANNCVSNLPIFQKLELEARDRQTDGLPKEP